MAQDATFEGVAETIAEMFGVPEESVARESKLSDFSIDSLAMLDLAYNLDKRFRVKMTDKEVVAIFEEGGGTIRELAEVIDAHLAQQFATAEMTVPQAKNFRVSNAASFHKDHHARTTRHAGLRSFQYNFT